MHIPDGFLDGEVALATGALALGAVAYGLRRAEATLDERRVPLLGVCGAFVFAAQMLNFPVGAGTSGHLLGGTLAAVRPDAKDAEKAAAVKWIDFYYEQPLVDQAAAVRNAETLKAGKQSVGTPALPVFDKTQYDLANTWIKAYINVPQDQMKPFTDNIFNQKLVAEPAASTQSVPTVVAVLAGQPLPLFQGAYPREQVRAVLDQVLAAAEANGITGRATPSTGAVPDEPEPEPELELAARLTGLAARNRTDLASFLGAGVYRHWSPPAVDQLLLRGEWYTAYTPYQPEISQGTLQSIYEYESLLAELVDLDVVSASHYDGAAA